MNSSYIIIEKIFPVQREECSCSDQKLASISYPEHPLQPQCTHSTTLPWGGGERNHDNLYTHRHTHNTSEVCRWYIDSPTPICSWAPDKHS